MPHYIIDLEQETADYFIRNSPYDEPAETVFARMLTLFKTILEEARKGPDVWRDLTQL